MKWTFADHLALVVVAAEAVAVVAIIVLIWAGSLLAAKIALTALIVVIVGSFLHKAWEEASDEH